MIINKKRNYLLRLILALLTSLIITVSFLEIYNLAITTVGMVILFSLLIIVFPLFLVRDIFHPFIILSISMLLAVIDFLNKDLSGNTNSKVLTWVSGSDVNYLSIYSLVVIICWYIFVYYGFLMASKIKKKQDTNFSFPKVNSPIRVSIILGIAVVLGFLYSMSLLGGISGMINAMTHTTVAYSGLGYLRNIVGIGIFVAFLLLYGGYKKCAILFLIATSIMLTFFGGRANVILGTILPFLMVYHYRVEKIRIWKLSLLAAIGLIFVEVIGVMRKMSESTISFGGIWELIVNAAQATGRSEIVPALIGSILNGNIEYQLGKPFINIIFAPIPRTLWDGKPEIIDDTVLIAYELNGVSSYGMPAGPYGWAFFNFGWIGVIVMGLLTGYIIQKLYIKLVLERKTKDDFISVMFYSLIIQSVFNIFSTSPQAEIIWIVGIFLMIYFLDFLFALTSSKSRKYSQLIP
ncbi:O-antigen polymerase [Psychrobacillus sp. OK032]|uniref:O-antigen polymerase n=1 Tax=Psychrobacillus sp. OK032 TaxID=1884358 RepID=UPI0008BC874B|nr:O-antigen polymerase [Psychrobacillus sp. OK032]SER70872.1 oligosaccharide repeat unit polymerase [Psychrobacillus sp. OK032]